MQLPKTILVPTDFSKSAEAALDYAVMLGAKLDAKIHLLNVVTIQVFGAEGGLMMVDSMLSYASETGLRELERLVAARTGQAVFGPTLLELGDARVVIEQIAQKLGADLVVMGTRGRSGIKRLVLGSVAESVARHAPCPVLLVREIEHA